MAEQNLDTVLVVGAGVGGIKAAIDLAERGRRVILAEASPALGGILSQLDYQFPNNHCGLCRMLPPWERDTASEYCMRKGLFHENIRIMPLTDLIGLEGEAGRFEATLRTLPRGVDPGRCIGCGRCEEACPIEVKDTFNEGLSNRKAIHRDVPHNVPFSYVIDFEACTKCGKCVEICPTEAVSLDEEAAEAVYQVGAVILAPGCGLYDPAPPDAYNYHTLPDVITSLELERLLSGSGPTSGVLLRPSNGEQVRSVAWIQCVGSRNARRNQDFCSSICCMFALKETLLVKERSPETETSVFYMDMRAYGKEGYRYQLQSEASGTEFLRCRVHTVEGGPDGRVYVKYYLESEGRIEERAFDMVVLSTGQAATPAMQNLAQAAGVRLNACGFAPAQGLDEAASGHRPGVFWCGSATGLKDISETVIQAESAAAKAFACTGFSSEEGETRPPAPRDVSREIPRVGVLLCKCLGGQGTDLPWDEIRGDLTADPDIAFVLEGDLLCRTDGFENAEEKLKTKSLNRLVVGACAPYVYDRRLRKLAAVPAIAENLVEVVDLRGSGLLVGESSEKRRMAVSSIASAAQKLKHREFPVITSGKAIREVVIIGGGLAGMTAALTIADSGVGVRLLEKESRLGGETRRRRFTLDGGDPASLLSDLEEKVRGHKGIQVYTGATLIGLNGEPGRFSARVRTGEQEESIVCGAVIVATGSLEAGTEEYGLGRSDRILRQGDLEALLADGKLSADHLKRVFMIQCAGSRDPDGRAYCSRICCASALKNASKILEVNPDADIYVLYRDFMSYGFMESRYRELREAGVQFITYSPEEKPQVTVEGDKPVVRFKEPILGQPVDAHPDLLVLSTGMEPSDNRALAHIMGLRLNEDGFFNERDHKWRPVDLERPGIFVCGTAHSPGNMEETAAQARAAAMRALILLRYDKLPSSISVSDVRKALCSICETCISVCPFEARFRDKDGIHVISSACQGCGLCAAACPNGAAWLPMYTDRQAMSMIESLMA